MRAPLAAGTAETLCGCLPIPDVAKSLPYDRTECNGQTAAVDHSMSRHPIELLAAPGPLARGANISHNRPRSSSGCAEAPQSLDVAPAAAAWQGAAPTSQPSRHSSGIELGGLAAHGTNVERWR
jgi:hypothetical protein